MKYLFLTILIIFSMVAEDLSGQSKTEKITFGAGCFWCVEAAFQRIKGVEKVESGYMGGTKKDPTYKEVCTGLTGHAEVVRITYYPDSVSFGDLLKVFFTVHDPTTLNRQGNDVGTQYRSVIFYYTTGQKKEAEEQIKEKMGDLVIDGVKMEQIAENLFYPIKSPAKLLQEIKEYLEQVETEDLPF